MTAKHALAVSLTLITFIAVSIFARQLSSRSYPGAWLRRQFLLLWSKQVVFFLVLFEAGLLLTSALPVLHEAKNKSDFTNYIAFSFPCLAGLVAGGGFFFDTKKRLTKEVNAFFASAVLIGIGYVVYIAASPFAASVALWGCLQAVGCISVALACLLVTRKHFRFASDGIFLPSIILLGFFSMIVGLAYYWAAGSAQTP